MGTSQDFDRAAAQLKNLFEQELSPSKLGQIFDSVQEGLVITDADLEAPGPRILAVNPGFTRITGYGPAEVIGKSPRILQGPRTEPEVVRGVTEALRSGRFFHGETYNYRKNGEEFLMNWYVKPMPDGDGVVNRYLGVQRDVTEARRLESLMRAAGFAENLGFLASGLRHELGNPVNSAKFAVSLLARHLDQLEREKILQYLDGALEELGQLELLLKALKPFSFREKVVLGELALGPFLEEFFELVRPAVSEAGARLETRVPRPDLLLEADPRALHQLLAHLVGNALDAVRGGAGREICILASSRGGWAEIRIEDDGIGLTDVQLQELFKPFYSSKRRGIGMGLVLARHMALEMGGELTVGRRSGAGVAAVLRLALAAEGTAVGEQ